MIEAHDAVGDVFLEAVARAAALTLFGGHDTGDAAIGEPPEQAVKRIADRGPIRLVVQQHLERVDDDALGLRGIDGARQPHEQRVEIVVALPDLARRLDARVLDRQQLPRHQVGEIEAERSHVAFQIVDRLFEREEDAGLAVLLCTDGEKLQAP